MLVHPRVLSRVHSRMWMLSLSSLVAMLIALALPALALAGELTGTVVDSFGEPVALAEVAVYTDSGLGDDSYQCVDTTLTSELGVYRLSNLPEGQYRLRVLPFGDEFDGTWYGGLSYATAEPLQVTEAGTLTVPLTITRNGRITGSVTDGDGHAIPGALVRALPVGDLEDDTGMARSGGTDEFGMFDIGGLIPYQDYLLLVSAEGFEAVFYDDPMDGEPGPTAFWTGAGETKSDLSLQLSSNASIAGTVRTGGSVMENVEVVVWRQGEGGEWLQNPVASFTDTQGVYVVDDLSPGSYKMRFAAPFTTGVAEKYYQSADTLESADTTTLVGGQRLSGVDIDLGLAAQPATITGRITDRYDAILSGAKVEAYAHVHGELQAVATVQTSAENGEFVLPGLPPGTYSFKVSYGALPSQWISSETSGAPRAEVLSAGEAKDVGTYAMREGSTIYGSISLPPAASDSTGTLSAWLYKVRRSADGTVTYEFADRATQSEWGEYSLWAIMPGEYVLQFASTDNRLASAFWSGASSLENATPIVFGADQTLFNRNATLPVKGSLSGRITDGSATGLSGIRVRAIGASVEETLTTDTGDYQFDYIAQGDYVVEFSDPAKAFGTRYYIAEGSGETSTSVTVVNGEQTTGIDGVLAKQASVSGAVVDAVGGKLSSVAVRLYDCAVADELVEVAVTETDAEGEYHFRGIDAGNYALGFSVDASVNLQPQYYGGSIDAPGTTFAIANGEQWVAQPTTMAAGATVSGSVRDSNGEALALATVRVSGAHYDRDVLTSSDGSYTVVGLPPGEYAVSVVAATGSGIAVTNAADTQVVALVVTVGATVEQFDFQLPCAAAITGRVTDALSASVAGARLRALAYYGSDTPTSGTAYEEVDSADITGDDGLFVLGGLAPGHYKVRVDGPSGGSLSSGYVGGDTLAQASVITVPSGGVHDAGDVVLGSAVSVSGTVEDESGSAITATPVYVTAYRQVGAEWVEAAQVQASASGEYEFRQLVAGTYKFGFYALGHQVRWYSASATLAGATQVVVSAEPVVLDAVVLATAAEPVLVSSIEVGGFDEPLEIGAARQMVATATPANATDQRVGWLSDKPSVADVTAAGMLTAALDGTATITAYALDGSGVQASIIVTVASDQAPPVVSCEPLPLYADVAEVVISAADTGIGVASISYKRDAETTVTVGSALATVMTAASGEHTLTIVAADKAGNVSAPITRTFAVRKTAVIALSSKSNASVAYGAKVSITGTLTSDGAGLPGKTVVLQRSTNASTWSDTAYKVTTSATGVFTIPVTQSVKTWYRARFAGIPNAYSESGPTASVYLTPKVYLGTPVAPSTMYRGRTATVYGYLKPRHTSGTTAVRIYMERYVSRKWVHYGSGYTAVKVGNYSSYSKYSGSVKFPYTGKWRVRAYHADSGHAATSSGYDYVTVR